MTTFIWKPSSGVNLDYAPKITETKFGDGYAQNSPRGINHNPETWTLSFEDQDEVQANAIMDFLFAAKGMVPFTWVNMRGVTKLYTCKTWSRGYNDEDKNSVRAKFEEFNG